MAPSERVEPIWVVREPDPSRVAALTEALGLDEVVAGLLVSRGVETTEEARRFLAPRLAQLPDPFTMKGMALAVDRLVAGIEAGERICVFCDYDVDGVTSACEMVWFFRALGAALEVFVPDRFVDGYGLAASRIEALAGRGVTLLVTVDCGISDAAEVELARSLGMDVIVVDHHQVPPEPPRAVAVLDPHQPGCEFADKHLAACGVTFMLLVALRARLRERGRFVADAEPDLRQWLDLVALGTVADLVPLQGLNRVIVAHGLRRIAESPRHGVRSLCHVAGVDRRRGVTAGQVGFHLGPRINAAGRVAHASAGVELLTTVDAAEAIAMAEAVEAFNKERQGIQAEILDAAIAMADADEDASARRSLVLACEGWHPGVLGIVASKLVERYHRPTLLLAIADGVARGSARSIPGFRLVEHLAALGSHLASYGGHDYAAGLSLAADDLDDFRAAFEARAREALAEEDLRPRLRIDAEVPLHRLDRGLVDGLALLAPYGMGNPEPALAAYGVHVLAARAVGRDRTHLKLTLDAEPSGPLDAIAFGMAERAPEPGDRIDVVYVAELNEYNGRVSLQARIKALRPASSGE